MKKETHSHLAKAERCRMEWEAQHSIKIYCFSECVLGPSGERYVVPLFITVERLTVTATQSKNQALNLVDREGDQGDEKAVCGEAVGVER